MNIKVIFEDENIVVIDKPAGIYVHGGEKIEEKTVADWILEKYPEIKGIGENQEGVERPGIVHRLDKDTSGVMVIARTQEAYEELKKRFQKRQVIKEYHAFVHGIFAKKRGTIDLDIGRSRGDFRRVSSRDPRGNIREAITEYVVAESLDNISFVKFFPKTGRTHQIRVHSSSINHSIIKDDLYGGKDGLGFERLALHSYRISILFHEKDKDYSFTAEYPEDFKEALKIFAEK